MSDFLTGELFPQWIHDDMQEVLESDFMQGRADIYRAGRIPDGKGGMTAGTPVKIAKDVHCTVRRETGQNENRIGESQTDQVVYRLTFPLKIEWLVNDVTSVQEKHYVMVNGIRYEVSQLLQPNTYEMSQQVLAVRR